MSDYGGFSESSPSPTDVNLFHNNDDCDSSWHAHHHTIGNGPNQSASGKTVADLVKLVDELQERVYALEHP